MCGIAGVYQRNGHRVAAGLVESIGRSMTHRGPDNFSCLGFDKLTLSHNRLSLLDPSPAANQPFRDDDYALVYNGEIYNFRELRGELESRGISFRTTSDTEVLFQSLIADGVAKTLAKIRGMFAFAFFDRRDDTLYLARDRFGIKPLYWTTRAGEFFWSSEIKALAAALDLRPDPVRTLFAITGGAERAAETTLFAGVTPVRPGTYMTIHGRDEPRESVFYEIADDIDDAEFRRLDKLSARGATDEFDALLTDSVRAMLVSDAPLGSFVSGGVDSSLISAIARRENPSLALFTADVTGRFSEFADASALARHLESDLFDFKFRPAQMLEDWAEVTYFYESPLIVHTNAVPFASVARLASDAGVKAVLTGEGADELFIGYPRLLAKRYERIASLPVEAVKSLYRLVPGLREFLFPEPAPTPLAFLGRLAGGFESARADARRSGLGGGLAKHEADARLTTVRMMGEHLATLLHRNDRMGMMASIEARFPFLDERVVRFAVNLPARFKAGFAPRFHNYKHPFLIDKKIVRDTASRYLPQSLAMKPKNGFPMSGHKYVRLRPGFFAGGWLDGVAGLAPAALAHMTSRENQYFVAKLASIEIFGRLFGGGGSVEDVRRHVLANAEMII